MITTRSYRWLACSALAFASVVCRPAFADDDPALDVLAAQAPQVAVEVVNHRLIDDAMSHLGVRYRYGGSTPQTGFDCSGLVRWVFDQSVGVVLPRRAIEIAQLGAKIDMDDLKPGDLVFFNTLRKTFSHVGIYLGDGRFVHAPSRGGKVRVEELDDNYWRTRFTGGRRITDGDAPMPSIR